MKGRSNPIPNKDAGTMPANAPERGLTSRSADVNVQSGRFATVRLLQVLMIAALVLPLLCRGGRGRRQDPGGRHGECRAVALVGPTPAPNSEVCEGRVHACRTPAARQVVATAAPS